VPLSFVSGLWKLVDDFSLALQVLLDPGQAAPKLYRLVLHFQEGEAPGRFVPTQHMLELAHGNDRITAI
jgi:hypothetical protein